MLFDPDTVQAFKENADLAEFLALCRWGWQCGKLDNRPAGYFGKWMRNGKRVFKTWDEFFGFLCRVKLDGQLIERHPHGWPPVRGEVTRWAIAAAGALSRREVEYLCAVFLASINPDSQYNDASWYAVAKDFPAIVEKMHSDDIQYTMADLYFTAMKEAQTGDAAELAYLLGIRSENQKLDTSDRKALRNYFMKWFPNDSERAAMFRHICAHSQMDEKRQKNIGKFPSFALVGKTMRIQRAQAGQLGKRAFKKLHRAGLFGELAGLFGVHSDSKDLAPAVNDDAAFWEERTASI